jgi:hypothetical protein
MEVNTELVDFENKNEGLIGSQFSTCQFALKKRDHVFELVPFHHELRLEKLRAATT